MKSAEIYIEENYYQLDKETYQHITNLMNWFFDKIQTMIDSNQIFQDLCVKDFILLIAEFYDYFVDQNKWLENLYKLFGLLKTQIENGDIRGSGLFSGLSGVAIAVYNVTNYTGYYKKLLHTVNTLLTTDTANYIEFVTKNSDNLHANHYDTITGLAGTANYLLLDPLNNADLLNKICDYYTLLCDESGSDQISFEKWFIKKENIAGPDAFNDYDRGCLNFSLSHGMAGPLLILSKVYASCIGNNKNVVQLIKQFLSLYEEWGCPNEYDVLLWPGQLNVESYLAKQYLESLTNCRCSWCYGSIGISHALLTACRNIGNNHFAKKYFNNIEKICQEPIQNHLFSSPHICHGCAGELVILNKWNRIIKSKYLDKRIMELLDIILFSYNPNYIYGFKNFEYNWKTRKHEYSDDVSFLEGTIGIMLALLGVLKINSCLYENHLLI